MEKVRGFEKVSLEQFTKDFKKVVPQLSDESIAGIYEAIKLPRRGTPGSAGYDFYAPINISLQPNDDFKMPSGIKAYMQDDEKLGILPKSGLGFKYYVRLANTEGIVDSDYYNNVDNEGHIFIKVRNEGSELMFVPAGEGFAQGIFEKYLLADNDEPVNAERKGGLGHTYGLKQD